MNSYALWGSLDTKSNQKLFIWFIIIFKVFMNAKHYKTAIFDVQLPFHALKRLNDSHTLTNLFYACFNGLKLVCKSYVNSKIR